MPITQEKLEHEYRSCSIILSLISVSHSSVFVQLTHTCRQTNPSNCGMIPLAAPLGAPTRSRALWVLVFHNSSKHSRQACFFFQHNSPGCYVTEKLICSARILYPAAMQLWHPSTNQPIILEYLSMRATITHLQPMSAGRSALN